MWCRAWLVLCLGCGRLGFDPIASTGDAIPTTDVSPTGNNIAFATAGLYTGALGGLAGADAMCMNEAANAGLGGHYVAWLSTTTVAASSRLVLPGTSTPARGWIRRDGKPVADQLSDLLAGKIYYPIRLDAAGNDLAPTTHQVLTGTAATGVVQAGQTCNDWIVGDSSQQYEAGDIARTTNDWTAFGPTSCGIVDHLYCFGIDTANPLPPIPAPAGRIAFVSSTSFDTTMQRSFADTACANEATANSLAGTFLAFVATTQASAESRFNPAPGPWYRVDGIPLASTGAVTLAFDPLDTPLSIEANGNPIVTHVWAGASDTNVVAGPTGDDCADWSTNLSAENGQTGKSVSSTSGFSDGAVSCASALPVYCFQQ